MGTPVSSALLVREELLVVQEYLLIGLLPYKMLRELAWHFPTSVGMLQNYNIQSSLCTRQQSLRDCTRTHLYPIVDLER